MSENELLPRAAAGDVSAFERLYAQFFAFAVAKARRLAADPCERELAEDAAQLAFMSLWRGEWRLTDAGDPRGMIASRTRDYFRTLRQHQPARRNNPLPDNDDAIDARILRSPVPSIEDVLIDDAERQQLRAAVARLQPREREMVRLRYAKGLPLAGVAIRIGWHPNTICTHLGRIRRQLAAALGREYAGGYDTTYEARNAHRVPVKSQNQKRLLRRERWRERRQRRPA